MRKFISLTAFFSFILLLLSSIILYITPEGRVAYWGNWKILGLGKSEWGGLHITVGFLFLATAVYHIILNWKPILNYIKKPKIQQIKNPAPVILALALTGFIFVGTIYNIQPMKQVLTWNTNIKAYQAKVNGNPPYGHAELSSLENFCGFLGYNVDEVIKFLKEKQLKGDISKQSTIADIAKANGHTPQKLYELIQSISGDTPILPTTPPEGMGKMTLTQLCDNYKLPEDEIISKLEISGLTIDPATSIKEIAQTNNIPPLKVYDIIKDAVNNGLKNIEMNKNNMFLENESIYGFEETVEKLSAKIPAADWKISIVHNLQETLHKNGKEVLPVKILELCNPEYSGKLLEKDTERLYSSLMPCRISVYQTSDGKVHISRMNSAMFAAQIGGLVEETMSSAFRDIEKILEEFEKHQ